VTVLVLSIRQPWAYLVANGFKDVENRTWSTKFRGKILLHAGKAMTRQEYADARDFMNDIRIPTIRLPAYEELERGGIVGTATLVDCVYVSPSPWFVGPVGWVLQDAKPVRFVPCPGQLGLFMAPSAVVDMVIGNSNQERVSK